MSRLHLTVFGPPQVHHGDQRLTFSTRKELALLIYLALEPQQHQRKKLTDLLWPESDAMRGSAAFRTVLSRLRDTLRETPAQEDAHLEVERTTIGLSRDHITVDLLALDAACLRAKQVSASTVSPGSEELQTATEELVQASLLVRGPFLQDFIVREAPAFEEWTRSQREYWQVRLRLFFDQLAFLQEGMGLREQALESTRRWLAVDPLHEEGYLRLMRLYESLGNRRAALEAYEVYRIDLEHELHALPSPPLTALAERLRRGTPAVQTRPSTNLTAPPAALTLLQTPFIGREQEFSRLVEGYTRMQMKSTAERTQVVLVEGEAGIGKTRLVSEFVTWTEEQGAEVLAGRAFEIGGRLPYQPLIHALRPRLDAENAPEDLLADVWLSALSCLFPELRERYPDLPPPSNEEAGASTQLFEAVARLIEAWARRKPVVLWLDDLHWADVASLDLLVYLIGCWQERNTPVLLLLSLRNEARYSSALLEWKASLSHSTMPIVLQLSSLSINETKQVVLALSGGMKPAVSEQVGGWLYRETAGHPFYLLETLKLLLERQAVRPIYLPEQGWVLDFTGLSGKEHLQQGLLPASVRELIRARMSHLSAQAQAMLLAAAVLDRDSSFESLVEVAGLSETEALAGLDEVLAQRFVMESLREREGHAESVYLFTHDKLREVVYLEASEARRGVFHRRAFGLLQRTAAPAADIAHQARYAGLREACFRYNVQAGNDAMAVFAVQDAITFYERASRARSASRIQKVASPSEYIHLYEQLGRGYELLQKLEQAHYAYQLMLSLAQEAGDQERLWRATHHIAILGTGSLLRPEVGRQWIQKRQQTQDSASPPLQDEKGGHATSPGPFDSLTIMREYAHRALEHAHSLQREDLIAESLFELGIVSLYTYQWEQALACAQEAVELFEKSNDLAMQAESLGVLSNALLLCGRLQEAAERVQAIFVIEKELDNEYTVAANAFVLAWVLLERSEYEQALLVAERGFAAVRKLGLHSYLFLTLLILGDIQAALFQLTAARQTYMQAQQVLPFPQFGELVASRLCTIAVLEGEWTEAYQWASEVLERRPAGERSLSYLFLWHEIAAMVHEGHVQVAEETVRRLEELVGENQRFRYPALRARAVLAQWYQDTQAAIAYLQEAAHLAEALGLSGEKWQLQRAFAEVYEASGDRKLAQQAFAQAAKSIRELAEKISDEFLRSSFLASPPVLHVLQHEHALPQTADLS